MEEHILRLPWCDDFFVHHAASCNNTRRKSTETVATSSDTCGTPTPSFDDSIETVSTACITEASMASIQSDWSPSSSCTPANVTPSPPRTQPSRRRRCRSTPVSFGTVHVRTYERILLAHPACSHGPGIGLGWAYDDMDDAKTLATYEQESQELRQQRLSARYYTETAASLIDPHNWHVDCVPETGSDNNPQQEPVNDTPAQVLPCQERVTLLREWGFTRRDMQQATIEIARTQRERNATVRQVRREARLARRQERREKLRQQWNDRRWFRWGNKKEKPAVVVGVVELATEEDSSSSSSCDDEQSSKTSL